MQVQQARRDANISDFNEYKRLASCGEGLEVYVLDDGSYRRVRIKGRHVLPSGTFELCDRSDFETMLSVSTLEKIALKKGRYFRDEVARSEDPGYMKGVQQVIEEFSIPVSNARILDFGCGAGAFALNLLRQGASDIIAVDVDAELLDIAVSRLNDFRLSGCEFKSIDFVDKTTGLPFHDGEFDIVWPHAVLEHVFPRQRKFVLRELWRVLKKGGLLIVDATPNRLWIKEYHTSRLFFVNYLPLSLAAGLARRFSERVDSNEPGASLLARGFRGSTYWEIARAIPGSTCLNNLVRKRELSIWMESWRKEGDSRIKRGIKEAYNIFMGALDPVLGLLKIPQSVLLPALILVFRKP